MKIKIKTPQQPANIGHIEMQRMNIMDLQPADYNPRIMTDRARQGLSNSIDTFGLMQPIIYNKQTGNVVGGHQRLYDLVNKGIESTDVLVVDMDLEKEKAANITLNNASISGEFTDNLQDLLHDVDDELADTLLLNDLLDKDDFNDNIEDNDPETSSENAGGPIAENVINIEFLPEDYELFLNLISKFKLDYSTPTLQYKHGLKLGQLLRHYNELTSLAD